MDYATGNLFSNKKNWFITIAVNATDNAIYVKPFAGLSCCVL